MIKYYLHDGLENKGPFSIEELKNQQIKKSTPIWKEGMEDWKNAADLSELEEIFSATPPPLVLPPVYRVNSEAQIPKRHGLNWLQKVGLSIIIVFVGAICISAISDVISENDSSGLANKEMTILEKETSYPQNYLITGGKYRENFLGDKLKIAGYIENNASLTTYKDVVINVNFYSKTKTLLSTEQYTIYEFFPPASKKPFELKVNNYNNISGIGWEVSTAKTY